jgi:Domain of unknown function (DUF1707)
VAYGPGQVDPAQTPNPALLVSTGPVSTGPGPYPVNPAWLAATADRERTVGVLRAGFAEGRLTQEEFGERVAQAYASRTYGDLWALTADLPVGPFPVGPYPPGRTAMTPSASPAGNWRSAAALVITALVIFSLAALVTAIITAHVQPAYPGFVQPDYSKVQPGDPGFQPAKFGPSVHLLPDVQHVAVPAPGK